MTRRTAAAHEQPEVHGAAGAPLAEKVGQILVRGKRTQTDRYVSHIAALLEQLGAADILEAAYERIARPSWPSLDDVSWVDAERYIGITGEKRNSRFVGLHARSSAGLAGGAYLPGLLIGAVSTELPLRFRCVLGSALCWPDALAYEDEGEIVPDSLATSIGHIILGSKIKCDSVRLKPASAAYDSTMNQASDVLPRGATQNQDFSFYSLNLVQRLDRTTAEVVKDSLTYQPIHEHWWIRSPGTKIEVGEM